MRKLPAMSFAIRNFFSFPPRQQAKVPGYFAHGLILALLLFFAMPAHAQTPAQAWGVLDFSGCSNGTTPTQTNLNNSLFGTFYSSTTWNVVNGGATFQCSTGNIVPWQTAPTLSGVSWPNSSTTCLLYTSPSPRDCS